MAGMPLFRRQKASAELEISRAAPTPAWEHTIGRPAISGGAEALLQLIVNAGAGGLLNPDRDLMMMIPAVRRARSVICNTVAGMPMRTWVKDAAAGTWSPGERPAWMVQPEPWRAPFVTWTWVLEDLMFHPYAWLHVESRNAANWPTSFARIEPSRVFYQTQNETGRPIRPVTWLDGKQVGPDEEQDLIRIDGPDDGLLKLGGPAISTAWQLERAANTYADVTLPMIILKYVGQGVLGPNDAKRIRDDWDAARRSSTTGVLSANMDTLSANGLDPEKLQLVESRQYSALEVSRTTNLPPRYVGATSGDSMTYSSTREERRDLVDLSLRPYINCLAGRLSMGDITPRGTIVRLDSDQFVWGSASDVAAYIISLVDAGIITAAEGRARLDLQTIPGDDRV